MVAGQKCDGGRTESVMATLLQRGRHSVVCLCSHTPRMPQVVAYNLEGYWEDVGGCIGDFYAGNMKLLSNKPQFDNRSEVRACSAGSCSRAY